jgi:hypothetical protein
VLSVYCELIYLLCFFSELEYLKLNMGDNEEVLVKPKDKNELISQFKSDISSLFGDFKCDKIIPNANLFSNQESELVSMVHSLTSLVKHLLAQNQNQALGEKGESGARRVGVGNAPVGRGEGGIAELGGISQRGGKGRGTELGGDTVDQDGTNPWKLIQNANQVKNVNKILRRMEFVESGIDECEQLNRKGTVICSAPDFKWENGVKVKTTGLFANMKTMSSEGEEESKLEDFEFDLTEVCSLIEQKYGVIIPDGEIYAAHWLPNGKMILRMSYRHPTKSAWALLMKKIRSGGAVDLPFYCNVNLTRKRQTLFNEARNLKYRKKIQQYSVRENGSISIRMINGQWKKVTQHYNNIGDIVPTMLPNELLKFVG